MDNPRDLAEWLIGFAVRIIERHRSKECENGEQSRVMTLQFDNRHSSIVIHQSSFNNRHSSIVIQQ